MHAIVADGERAARRGARERRVVAYGAAFAISAAMKRTFVFGGAAAGTALAGLVCVVCVGCYDGAFEGVRSESSRVQNRIENDPLTQRLRGSGPQRGDAGQGGGEQGGDAGAPSTASSTHPSPAAPASADGGKELAI